MQEPFDPYRKWLGIPPKDQPPNYYRLLGLQDFETDAETIDHAAYQRMAYVRDFQGTQHEAEAGQILNEISRARVCLADLTAKLAYDQRLREQLGLLPPAPRPITPQQVRQEAGQVNPLMRDYELPEFDPTPLVVEPAKPFTPMAEPVFIRDGLDLASWVETIWGGLFWGAIILGAIAILAWLLST